MTDQTDVPVDDEDDDAATAQAYGLLPAPSQPSGGMDLTSQPRWPFQAGFALLSSGYTPPPSAFDPAEPGAALRVGLLSPPPPIGGVLGQGVDPELSPVVGGVPGAQPPPQPLHSLTTPTSLQQEALAYLRSLGLAGVSSGSPEGSDSTSTSGGPLAGTGAVATRGAYTQLAAKDNAASSGAPQGAAAPSAPPLQDSAAGAEMARQQPNPPQQSRTQLLQAAQADEARAKNWSKRAELADQISDFNEDARENPDPHISEDKTYGYAEAIAASAGIALRKQAALAAARAQWERSQAARAK